MSTPLVGIIMGSDSDLPIMRQAADICKEFDIPCELRILSAHRAPLRTIEYAKQAAGLGMKVIIAGAGGAAHLPGIVAAITPLPVIGVPVPLSQLDGMDSLLSIVQMPKGIPVATVGIGNAANAALLAMRILAVSDSALLKKVEAYQAGLEQTVIDKQKKLEAAG